MKFIKGHGLTKQKTILTAKQTQVLIGMLLGDGYLKKDTKARSITPIFGLHTITKGFIKNIKKAIPFHYHKVRIKKPYTTIDKNNTIWNHKQSYRLESYADQFLIEIYNKWYYDTKIIPKDLILTPLIVKYWFYGDGSTTRNKKHMNLVSLTLSTESFTISDVEFLQQRLKIDANLYLNINFNNHKPVLSTGNTKVIQRFFNYIGQCDIADFQYKWKIPTLLRKSIIIDNISYPSQTTAAKILGISQSTISKRVKQGIYKNG